MKIHERSKIIINILLDSSSYVTANEIAVKLNVSVKTVARQLSDVERILTRRGLTLERKTGSGMRIIGEDEAKTALQKALDENARHEYSQSERRNIILSQLLKSQEPVKLITLAKLLEVTDSTVSNDLDKLETWIAKMNLKLIRKPGLGIYLEGLEKDIRKAIINHIYTHIHEKDFLQLLYRRSRQSSESVKLLSDADRFLLDLVDKNLIQKVELAVQAAAKRAGYTLSENAFSGLVVHLTLAVQRLLKGEAIIIENGFLAKIKLKPEFAIAQEIGREIRRSFHVGVPDEETAYIAMHLMGARNNYQQSLNFQYDNFQLVKIAKQIIDIAEKQSGLSVAKKSKVLMGLVKHLGPAATRMKLKMEIRNPLLTEMKERYPHWMLLAKKSVKPLEDFLSVKLPEAETAYIAMHIGAALDESKQKRRRFNVLVACPTGIGTSKLLASQLRREFSDLNIVAVVSAINIDYDFCRRENIAFIVSTVPIENARLPVAVVDFMLRSEDKETIVRRMNQSLLMPAAGEREEKAASLTEKLHQISEYGKYIKEILDRFFYIKLDSVKSTGELCDLVSEKIMPSSKAGALSEALKQRESKGSTVFNNLLLLHAKSKTVFELTAGVGKLSVPFSGGKENPNEKFSVVLVLIAPQNADEKALETIGQISESLVDDLNLFDILYEGSAADIFAELEKIYTNFFKEKYKKIMEV